MGARRAERHGAAEISIFNAGDSRRKCRRHLVGIMTHELSLRPEYSWLHVDYYDETMEIGIAHHDCSERHDGPTQHDEYADEPRRGDVGAAWLRFAAIIIVAGRCAVSASSRCAECRVFQATRAINLSWRQHDNNSRSPRR